MLQYCSSFQEKPYRLWSFKSYHNYINKSISTQKNLWHQAYLLPTSFSERGRLDQSEVCSDLSSLDWHRQQVESHRWHQQSSSWNLTLIPSTYPSLSPLFARHFFPKLFRTKLFKPCVGSSLSKSTNRRSSRWPKQPQRRGQSWKFVEMAGVFTFFRLSPVRRKKKN